MKDGTGEDGMVNKSLNFFSKIVMLIEKNSQSLILIFFSLNLILLSINIGLFFFYILSRRHLF